MFLSQPKTIGEIIGKPDFERVIKSLADFRGIVITEKDLESAKNTLNGRYKGDPFAEIYPDDQLEECSCCGGAGCIKIATGSAKSPTEIVPCPNPIHEQERKQRKIFGALYGDELDIRLGDIQDKPGNRNMLYLLRKIAANPWAIKFAYIYGPNGNGKTMGGQALYNQLTENGFGPVKYLTLESYIGFIKAAYDQRNISERYGHMSDQQRYEFVTNVTKCLIIDEFDFTDHKTPMTAYNMALIQRAISDRYRRVKAGANIFTLLISNQHPEKLGMRAVSSRIMEYAVIKNTASDYRLQEGS